MIERADLLVLDYVSRAADIAHGVLRQDQRLDFVRVLRARIERERSGTVDARAVGRILARLGEPAELVRAEVRRLSAAAEPEPKPAPEPHPTTVPIPGYPDGAEHSTAVFPRIVDDTERQRRPVPARGRVPAGRPVVRQRSRLLPGSRFRRAVMAGANPMATEGRDARTILKEYRREVAGMLLLVVAALLVPFRLPSVEIFPVPLLVWALATVVVLSSEGWNLRDRLIGLGAPPFAAIFGGLLFGGIRAAGGDAGFQGLLSEFFGLGGVLFMLGAAGGVGLLAYRLLNPPPRSSRERR
ncbi:hypothetical protein [Streptosporangium sp. KLBMP 9127]|nr:hypothetical protein [Streptosporangium sp. KLBMP 9127]